MSWVGPRADSLPMSCLPERQPTVLDLGEGEEERVPSSKSPSPMKVPSQTGGSRLSLSPVKIDHDVTKALQESITSLLGKRPSPEGDELVVGADDKTGPARRGRNGKRARPQKSKVLFNGHIRKLNSYIYISFRLRRGKLRMPRLKFLPSQIPTDPKHELLRLLWRS